MSNASSYLDTFTSAWSWDKRDPRVEHWPMMSSVHPTLALCSAYVLVVKVLGPRFMRDRDPFEIKWLMMAYNAVQVLGSAWVFQGFLRSGWVEDYNWVCDPVDRNPNPDSNGYKMATTVWVAFLFRFVDFCDTIFFIARKKFGHASTLQVLHHFLTPIYGWYLCRFYPGGNDSFGGMLNFFVHTVMYGYYFVAALGPEYQKYLWWKRHLTTFQILVFVVSFAKTAVNLAGVRECGFPWQMSLVTLGMFSLMLVLFGEFYYTAYVKKRKDKMGKKKKE